MLFFKLIVLLSFFILVRSFYLNVELNVCQDSERVDFESSCLDKEPNCVQDINYLKNFQDFSDFYVHYKGEIYHAFEDVLYFQTCFLTKKIYAPKVIVECTKDIPVTYIDTFGTNRSGYLNQYEVIRPKAEANTAHMIKRQVCTTGSSKIVYSLPKCINALVRIGTELELLPINRLGKAYAPKNEIDIFTGAYKKDVQDDLDHLKERNSYTFYGLLFVLFDFVILSVLYCLNCFNCCKNLKNSVKKKSFDDGTTSSLTLSVDQAPSQAAGQAQSQSVGQVASQSVGQIASQAPSQIAKIYPDLNLNELDVDEIKSRKDYKELQYYAKRFGVNGNGGWDKIMSDLKHLQTHRYHLYA